jgi:pectate lyase
MIHARVVEHRRKPALIPVAGIACLIIQCLGAATILIVGLLAGHTPVASAQTAIASGEALSPKLPDGRQRAFPSAEGFGAGAVGGRGGKVIYVVNMNESGEGSLRACIEASGPRTCIFRTGGTITLNAAPLVVLNPFLTIAGESAPGGGIAIRNGPKQIRPSIEIRTNDVIVRYLRLRPGPHAIYSCCSGALGMYTVAAKNIMLDHISVSWGSDETVDSEDATNFTWQWGIASEPLLNGGPGKKNRARNMLFTKGGDISVHHSLFAFGKFRNPQIKMKAPGAVADVVNNVFYSPKWQYVVSFGDEWAPTRANVVGNYKISGENEVDDHMVHVFDESGLGHSIFLKDNYDDPYRTKAGQDEKLVIAEKGQHVVVTTPFAAPSIHTSPPLEAYEEVLSHSGATKPERDAVDRRTIEEIKNRSGKLVKNDPNDVGGWPELAAGTPYTDKDKDGIADDWEIRNGLDPANGSDGQLDRNGDGWSNLEEFLQFMAGDIGPK